MARMAVATSSSVRVKPLRVVFVLMVSDIVFVAGFAQLLLSSIARNVSFSRLAHVSGGVAKSVIVPFSRRTYGRGASVFLPDKTPKTFTSTQNTGTHVHTFIHTGHFSGLQIPVSPLVIKEVGAGDQNRTDVSFPHSIL